MIFFYNFIHIFGVEVTSKGKNYQVLVGVQYVMMKPSDFTLAQAQTRAVQKILEDDQDLGVVFRQWCVRALERFIQQSGSGDTSSTSAGEERGLDSGYSGSPLSPFGSDKRQVAFSRDEKLQKATNGQASPTTNAADLVARIRTLMGTVE